MVNLENDTVYWDEEVTRSKAALEAATERGADSQERLQLLTAVRNAERGLLAAMRAEREQLDRENVDLLRALNMIRAKP